MVKILVRISPFTPHRKKPNAHSPPPATNLAIAGDDSTRLLTLPHLRRRLRYPAPHVSSHRIDTSIPISRWFSDSHFLDDVFARMKSSSISTEFDFLFKLLMIGDPGVRRVVCF
ncbi:hypothetical protein AKJ16_DCAP18616 [Drosera capensis]